MKKIKRFLLYFIPIAVATVCLLVLAVLLYVDSNRFRKTVEAYGTKELGTALRVGKIKVGLFGRISIDDIAIGETEVPGLSFSVKRIATDFGVFAALFGDMNRVEVDAPELKVAFDENMLPKTPQWALDLIKRSLEMESSTEGPLPEVVVRNGRILFQFPEDTTAIEIERIVLTPERNRKYYGVDLSAKVSGSNTEFYVTGDAPIYEAGGPVRVGFRYEKLDSAVVGSLLTHVLKRPIDLNGGRFDFAADLETKRDELSGTLEVKMSPMQCIVQATELEVPAAVFQSDFQRLTDGSLVAHGDLSVEGIADLRAEGSSGKAGKAPWTCNVELKDVDLAAIVDIVSATSYVQSGTLSGSIQSVIDPSRSIDTVLYLRTAGLAVKPFEDKDGIELPDVEWSSVLFSSTSETEIRSATLTVSDVGSLGYCGTVNYAVPASPGFRLAASVDMDVPERVLDPALRLLAPEYEIGVESLSVHGIPGRSATVNGGLDDLLIVFPVTVETGGVAIREKGSGLEIAYDSFRLESDSTIDPTGVPQFIILVTLRGIRANDAEVSVGADLVAAGLSGSLKKTEDAQASLVLDKLDCAIGAPYCRIGDYSLDMADLKIGLDADTPTKIIVSENGDREWNLEGLGVSLGSFKASGPGFEAVGERGSLRTGVDLSMASGKETIVVKETTMGAGRINIRSASDVVTLSTPTFSLFQSSVTLSEDGTPRIDGGIFSFASDWTARQEGLGDVAGQVFFKGVASEKAVRDMGMYMSATVAQTSPEIPSEFLPISCRLEGGSVGIDDMSVALPQLELGVGEVAKAVLSASGSWRDAPSIELAGKVDPVDLEEYWSVIAGLLGEGAQGWLLGGKTSLNFRAGLGVSKEGLDVEVESLRIELDEGSGFSPDGVFAWQESQGSLTLKGSLDERGGELTARAALHPHNILVGSKYMDFGAQSIAIDSKLKTGSLGSGPIEFRGKIGLPGSIAVDYSGSVDPTSATPEGRLSVSCDSIDLASAATVLVPIFLPGKSAMEMGTLDFQCDLNASGGREAARGRIQVASGAFGWGENNTLFASGVDADLPFQLIRPSLESSADAFPVNAGTLRIESIGIGTDVIGPMVSYFSLWDNRFALSQPLSLDLFGGGLRLSRFSVADVFATDLDVELSGQLIDMDLGEACSALGLPPLDGKISFRIPGIQTHKNTLVMDGTAEISVFGGTIRISNLRVEDYKSFSPIVGFSAEFEGIDLGKLTMVIPIGRIGGLVRGYARDFRLCLDPLEPYSFDIRIESDDSRPSRRHIGFDTVALFASMGDSDFSAYRGMLESADDYGYKQLGLSVSLKNDRIHAKGLVRHGGLDYFILGSGRKKVNLLVKTPERGYPYSEVKKVVKERIMDTIEGNLPDVSVGI